MEDFLGKFSCAGVVCHCLLLVYILYLIFLFKLMFRVAQSSRWFSYGIWEWFTESLTLYVILLLLVALFLYLTQAYWHSLSCISLVCYFYQRTQGVRWPRPTHSHSKTSPFYPSVPSPRLPHTRYHSIPNWRQHTQWTTILKWSATIHTCMYIRVYPHKTQFYI
jgi:hypothetical protein